MRDDVDSIIDSAHKMAKRIGKTFVVDKAKVDALRGASITRPLDRQTCKTRVLKVHSSAVCRLERVSETGPALWRVRTYEGGKIIAETRQSNQEAWRLALAHVHVQEQEQA